MASTRELHLVQEFGSLLNNWKWKERGEPFAGLPSVSDFIEMARRAEKSHLDAVFMADFIGLNRTSLARRAPMPFEPHSLLSAVAVTTSHIGLIGTQSTLFNQPYNVARYFTSLDHISNGRSAWNLVTSFNGERNFGLETLPSPEERYEAAQEFLDVTNALWASWAPDALIADPANPIYVDPNKVRDINHAGKYFRVAGALDRPPPVQGRPVLVQAGASDVGLDFAARNAEVLFIAAISQEHAGSIAAELTAKLEKVGRQRSDVVILPGLRPIIAATEAEARELRDAQYSSSGLDDMRAYVEREVEGLDLGGLDLDKPIPPERFPSDEAISRMNRRRSRAVVLREVALADGMTLRGFLHRMQGSGSHYEMLGTPLQIADEIETWYRSGAVDGFMVGAGFGHDLFHDEVVPELVRRGLFRDRYIGTTLRDHLGLPTIR